MVKSSFLRYISMHKCTICGKEFERPAQLKGHLSSHNRKKRSQSERRKLRNAGKEHKCSECGKVFENGWQLGGHQVWCKNPEEMFKKTLGVPHSHTKDSREKLSIARSRVIEELGVGGFKHVLTYNVSNIIGEEYCVRGKWELEISKWLNSNGIIWKGKKYLRYFDSEINRTYIPDFYLPDSNLYLEIKGYFSNGDKKKMEMVIQQNEVEIFLINAKCYNKLSSFTSLDELLTNAIPMKDIGLWCNG